MQLYQKTIVKDRCSYTIVIRNENTYLSISYDYGLTESYIYSRVTVLVKSHVYWLIKVYRVTIAIKFYLKKFEVYEVMDFIFTRKDLHLLQDYIYYNLQLFLL